MAVLLFQTTVQAWIAPWGFAPDLYIILIIYLGLNAPVTTGAILVTALGFLKDATGGGVLGFYPGIFLIIFIVAGQARQKLDPAAPWYLIVFIFAFSIWAGILAWVGFYFFSGLLGHLPESWYSPPMVYVVSSIFTAVIGPPVFWLLNILKPLVGPPAEHE